MLHIVPILCLIFFIGFMELQLKKELDSIEREFKELKEKILNNSLRIDENKKKINENSDNISDLKNGKHL